MTIHHIGCSQVQLEVTVKDVFSFILETQWINQNPLLMPLNASKRFEKDLSMLAVRVGASRCPSAERSPTLSIRYAPFPSQDSRPFISRPN